MTTNTASFDLTCQPWIPVIDLDGHSTEVSLVDVFARAHELADLAVEVPTLRPPLLRMLTAICVRALDGPPTLDAWEEIWNAPQLPTQPIRRYLDTWRHRFDLFDAEAPFMQAAGLSSDNGGTKTTAALLPHWPSGNNVPLFILARPEQAPALTSAAAARWLLHVHAWDTAGLKTGASDDPQASKGKTYGSPTGPLGSMNVVIPGGRTLRETLLLNLPPHDQATRVISSDDRPTWERPPMTGQWVADRIAHGPCEVFTWPSRRVRLIPEMQDDEVVVSRLVVTAGDRLNLNVLQGREPHAVFRRSTTVEKREKRSPVYRPVPPQADRHAWESLDSLLALHSIQAVQTGGADAPATIAPECLWFLGQLEDEGILDPKSHITLHTTGIVYGAQSAVIEQVLADALPVPLAVWSGSKPEAGQQVLRFVAMAKDCADELARYARNVLEANGDSDKDRIKSAGMQARRTLFNRLDPVFRQVLEELMVAAPNELEAQWARAVRQAVLAEADLLESQSSTRAFANAHKPLGRSYGWLLAALKKTLPTSTTSQEAP